MKQVFNEWTARGFLIVLLILLVIFEWPHHLAATIVIILGGAGVLIVSWLIGLLIQPSDPNGVYY